VEVEEKHEQEERAKRWKGEQNGESGRKRTRGIKEKMRRRRRRWWWWEKEMKGVGGKSNLHDSGKGLSGAISDYTVARLRLWGREIKIAQGGREVARKKKEEEEVKKKKTEEEEEKEKEKEEEEEVVVVVEEEEEEEEEENDEEEGTWGAYLELRVVKVEEVGSSLPRLRSTSGRHVPIIVEGRWREEMARGERKGGGGIQDAEEEEEEEEEEEGRGDEHQEEEVQGGRRSRRRREEVEGGEEVRVEADELIRELGLLEAVGGGGIDSEAQRFLPR